MALGGNGHFQSRCFGSGVCLFPQSNISFLGAKGVLSCVPLRRSSCAFVAFDIYCGNPFDRVDCVTHSPSIGFDSDELYHELSNLH